MILVEFTLEHPTLHEALSAAPGTLLRWEQSHRLGERDHQIIAWADGPDLDAFESALDGDCSVIDYTRAAESGSRRLYQFSLSDESSTLSVYPALMRTTSIIRELRSDADGWHFKVTFPDRDSLDQFRAFCDDHDLRYRVTRIYEDVGGPAEEQEFGLTEKQRALLGLATRRGYFDVPRRTGLEDLAAEANISHQAASELLRRAQARLNRRALGFDDDVEE